MSKWYYARNGQRFGPVADEQLKELAASGKVLRSDVVWTTGMTHWVPANSIKDLFSETPQNDDPPLPPPFWLPFPDW